MISHIRCCSCIALLGLAVAAHVRAADPIRVVVWDEQQPQQKEAYDNFLGNHIAAYLKSRPGFTVTSVRLDDPEQGLSAKVLDDCDVLIWWGHVRQREVKPEMGKEIGPVKTRIHSDALEALMTYEWPGNVRELANLLERAQILAEDHVITLDDLPEDFAATAPAVGPAPTNPRALRAVERRHVHEVLQQEKWNKVHAAKVLEVSRRALYRLIAKHHIEASRATGGAAD